MSSGRRRAYALSDGAARAPGEIASAPLPLAAIRAYRVEPSGGFDEALFERLSD